MGFGALFACLYFELLDVVGAARPAALRLPGCRADRRADLTHRKHHVLDFCNTTTHFGFEMQHVGHVKRLRQTNTADLCCHTRTKMADLTSDHNTTQLSQNISGSKPYASHDGFETFRFRSICSLLSRTSGFLDDSQQRVGRGEHHGGQAQVRRQPLRDQVLLVVHQLPATPSSACVCVCVCVVRP